jgi:hypothetical protein
MCFDSGIVLFTVRASDSSLLHVAAEDTGALLAGFESRSAVVVVEARVVARKRVSG